MDSEMVIQNYLEALLEGDRQQARSCIEQLLHTATPATTVYSQIIWPTMLTIEQLHKTDRITPVQEHLASRINRSIVDQLQNKLPRKQRHEKKIVVACSPEETHELGAQMTADLFESDGWNVRFVGGGINNQDLLAYVNDYGPDVLLLYGTVPSQAPSIRELIDTVRGVNAWPNMKIMVSGGLFNRAEGLWEEIGADLFAPDAHKAVEIANGRENTKPTRTINQRKRK